MSDVYISKGHTQCISILHKIQGELINGIFLKIEYIHYINLTNEIKASYLQKKFPGNVSTASYHNNTQGFFHYSKMSISTRIFGIIFHSFSVYK